MTHLGIGVCIAQAKPRRYSRLIIIRAATPSVGVHPLDRPGRGYVAEPRSSGNREAIHEPDRGVA